MFRTFALAALFASAATGALAQPLGPYASAKDQQAAMTSGAVTSEALVRAALGRIADLDHRGTKLNSVIVISPRAMADAQAMDAERRAGKIRGPLHGVPVLIKDNIESNDGTATTAGSLALKDNVTGRDAPLVQRLKAAGAVIIGKTNLSEWANYRSTQSISGWSAMGGLVHNPYALDRNACGSSSGSGAAVAAGFAALAVGTETDGSVTCPASFNGLVGFKPTLGLVSRTHVVPISPEQDTAGPMTRTVADAAALLAGMAGSDPADPTTRPADARKVDYLAALDANALKGARIGVLRREGGSAKLQAAFDQALETMRQAGAVLVDVKALPDAQLSQIGEAEDASLKAEFKAAINAYLATTPAAVKTRTLDDLIAFNAATPAETAIFGQEIFEAANKSPPLTDTGYKAKRAAAKRLAGPEGIDRMLKQANVEAIVMSGGPPAALVDPVNGDNFSGPSTSLAAVAGYPHLNLPVGQVSGLPVSLSIIGTAWSDARILSLGYALEQALPAWRPPEFLPTVNVRPELARALDVD
ncbi:amidase [Phenylobacterium deserti]|uniref:Amidase n=1 Tax=Phenylobacterium deserti TaxID=1914756 RepID=A0A328ANV8_9CAUL|nr:amidase [Phenylobacterium deserti]RAK56702.1 amidase [Phenylobacterium deserti]